MRRFQIGSIVACCALGLVLAFQAADTAVIAQETAGKAESKEKVAKKARKKARGRVPAYYGQIGLSRAQKEKIYAIQKVYGPQIAELRKQIRALEEKQQEEIDAVLTPEQKAKLAELKEAAAKRRASRSKKKGGASK